MNDLATVSVRDTPARSSNSAVRNSRCKCDIGRSGGFEGAEMVSVSEHGKRGNRTTNPIAAEGRPQAMMRVR